MADKQMEIYHIEFDIETSDVVDLQAIYNFIIKYKIIDQSLVMKKKLTERLNLFLIDYY